MPFTPNFSCAQNVLTPKVVILADTSEGADGSITQRRAYIQNYLGTYLVPTGTTTTYNQWALADSTISLNILTEDTAVSIRVDWLDSGNNVLYTLTQTFCLALYNKQFLYELVQGLVPTITLDIGYSPNLANLWTAILSAINAVEIGNDITASQACLNRASYLKQNQSLFF